MPEVIGAFLTAEGGLSVPIVRHRRGMVRAAALRRWAFSLLKPGVRKLIEAMGDRDPLYQPAGMAESSRRNG